MAHKFQLNQLVRLSHPRTAGGQDSGSGIFHVTRLMPADQTGEFSYRVKTGGAGERAVRESEIKSGGSDH